MKFEIKPYVIKKLDENKVTSPTILKKKQTVVSDEYHFDEHGIFSKVIFGNIDHCDCGNLQEVGFCKLCNCRVVDKFNMPEFFIDLEIKVPRFCADFTEVKNARSLLEYKAYLYAPKKGRGTIISVDDIGDPTEFFKTHDPKALLYGYEAAVRYNPKVEKWGMRYLTDYVSISHPLFRANLKAEDGRFITAPINIAFSKLLQNLEDIRTYKTVLDNTDIDTKNYYMMKFCREIYVQYLACCREIFTQLTNSNNGFLRTNVRAHPITSAIKGTVVNRADIDEDVILIGDTFIQTLFPYLYKKFNGDLEKINTYLINSDTYVVVNRPPTICHLSIVAMKPRVASCYKFGTVTDGALYPHAKSEYDENEDTIGIRTLGINPMAVDGMNCDFDGDTLLVISVFSPEALKECETMVPSKNYMNFANGTIRNDIIEDVEFVLEKLKKNAHKEG